ncbi:MAG: hypothetical protein OH337_03855 [Candidatus Parvarchaeota archaeon]|nr:hypothetical protein [Candidatus Haiyanarchaeum thermophilum]
MSEPSKIEVEIDKKISDWCSIKGGTLEKTVEREIGRYVNRYRCILPLASYVEVYVHEYSPRLSPASKTLVRIDNVDFLVDGVKISGNADSASFRFHERAGDLRIKKVNVREVDIKYNFNTDKMEVDIYG